MPESGQHCVVFRAVCHFLPHALKKIMFIQERGVKIRIEILSRDLIFLANNAADS